MRAAWRGRYCAGEWAELRVQALLERTERELRATGAETTIHALWVTLAGKAMGLVGVG